MAPCRMMVDNPMQEDRLVVPASEVRGSGANGLWVDRAGRHGMATVDLCMGRKLCCPEDPGHLRP